MIENLIEISRIVGMRNDYVQAGGGNTSVKLDDNYMAIKSSGYLLSDMKANDGYTVINYKSIRNLLADNKITEKQMMEKTHISGKKASIEVFLHALTYKYTVHIHSLLSNIILVRNNSEQIIKKLFPEAIFIDYTTPGVELGRKMLENYNDEKIIFLKNHGLIVTSDDYEEIKSLINEVDKKISEYLNIRYDSFNHSNEIYEVIKEYSNDLVYLSEDIDIYKAFEKNEYKLWNYRFCPDCVVYCGIKELNLETLNKKIVYDFFEKNGKLVLIVYDKKIYICAETLKRAREIESILSFSAKIFLQNLDSKLDYISDEEAKKLYNSDFEKYRQNIK